MTPALPCPFPLEKILVCTDDSPASQGAVNAAFALARACRGHIFLLYALEYFPYYEYSQPDALGMIPAVGQEFFELRERSAREHLDSQQREAAQQGLDLEIRLQTGTPVYAEILAAADSISPHLIIMGRKGKSGLERLLVGSVTARVIGHTTNSVLVVPRGAVLALTGCWWPPTAHLPASRLPGWPSPSPKIPGAASPRSPPAMASWTPSRPWPWSGN